MKKKYYTLVASLPHLPWVEEAEVLPINKERLMARLRMLDPEDLEDIEACQKYLLFRHQPTEIKDEILLGQYKKFFENINNETLQAFANRHMGTRILIASLRRKVKNMTPYPAKFYNALSGWAQHIENNWEDRYFKLSSIFPWVVQAREFLESGDALGLDRLLMSVVWRNLDRYQEGKDFEFEEVFAIVFKWHMLERWMAHNESQAQERFEELMKEVTASHEQVFS